MAPAPLPKRTLPLKSTLWNGHGPLKPTAPSERTVRSPHCAHAFLAVTGDTSALSSLIVHSMSSASSVVVHSQAHHQWLCGFTWIRMPCCLKTTETGHGV